MNNLVIRPPGKIKLNYMIKCIYLIAKKKKEEHLSPVNLNLNVLSAAKLLKQPICAAILVANATAGYYYKRKKITLRTSSVLFPSSPLAIHRAPCAVILLLLDEK